MICHLTIAPVWGQYRYYNAHTGDWDTYEYTKVAAAPGLCTGSACSAWMERTDWGPRGATQRLGSCGLIRPGGPAWPDPNAPKPPAKETP